MARTIAVIQASIQSGVETDPVLGILLTSTSNVAIWLLWTWVIATCQWTLENLFDALIAEVTAMLAAQTAHTLQWYATMAKTFQYGYALPVDSAVYSPVAPAGDPSLIVTYAASVEEDGQVRVKVATGSVGSLAALSTPQLTAFTAFMQYIKDAGVDLECTSGSADTFQPTHVIYYDPLQLNSAGQRLDGTNNTPLQDAINTFLDALPFNGVLILNDYIAALQAVPGIVIADVEAVQAFYGAVPPISITTKYTPDAGYLALDTVWFAANVTYVPYAV